MVCFGKRPITSGKRPIVVGPHQNLWSIDHSGFGGVFCVGFIKHYASCGPLAFGRDHGPSAVNACRHPLRSIDCSPPRANLKLRRRSLCQVAFKIWVTKKSLHIITVSVTYCLPLIKGTVCGIPGWFLLWSSLPAKRLVNCPEWITRRTHKQMKL